MSAYCYDLVLYGATGFLGRQLFAYLSRVPIELRWAIAGRNHAKLQELKAQGQQAGCDVAVLLADSSDQSAVEAMVSQTRIIVNTTGPYGVHGTSIVDACVRLKRHYIDATGETPWVRDLIDLYHDRAARNGTLIVPCCGFAAAPSDLGVYLIARALQRQMRNCNSSVRIDAYFRLSGGVSGGTLASAFWLHATKQAERMADLALLTPNSPVCAGDPEWIADPVHPSFDPKIGAWVGPLYHLGLVNTRVVRRSAQIFTQRGQPYGVNFSYQEFMKFEGIFAPLVAASATLQWTLFQYAMNHPLTRRVFASIVRSPGEGPSKRTMDAGWFQCELLGRASDGSRARAVISDQGDPGVRTTAKILCEAALCLAADDESLSTHSRQGGVLTPATALGESLIRRLRRAGMTIQTEILSDSANE